MHIDKYDHAPRLPEGESIDLDAIIPGEGKVFLEVGPGRGAFALGYAALHPETRFLAMEIRRKLAAQLDERLQKKGFPRARCFAEDAGLALPRLRPDGCALGAAVHFPDPWWKKRHAKRLVVQDSFVAELARLLAPGALLLVQTDVEDRAVAYFERLAACPALENTVTGMFADESPFAPARSNRETRAIADGLPIHRMVFRRR
jgi:tRNA (guanine-N7-)-methyltransferase